MQAFRINQQLTCTELILQKLWLLQMHLVGVGSAFVTADSIAPSTPTALTAAGTTDSSTNLSWNASTDNVGVTGYNIYKAQH
jgi:hypothetical protein